MAQQKSTTPSSASLQQLQTNSLISLLNLNETTTTTTVEKSGTSTPAATGPAVWKVLILDNRTKDVLATVLRVQDLRDNIKRIAEDLSAGLYDSYHLSFVEPLPRTLLEELANQVAKDGTNDLIEQVLDQYLSFPSVQGGDSTSLPTDSTSYYLLNAPSTTEQDIEAEVDRIANGLFSVVVTSGQVPYIR
ncbi:14240_t:CDS:2, partial [Acaulospora colombiana]